MNKRVMLLILVVVLAMGMTTLARGTVTVISAQDNTITYNSDRSDPALRAMDEKIVKLWNDTHPDMQVRHTIVEGESFKQAIRAYLVAEPAPDWLTWDAANRPPFFIDKSLIADISDVWKSEG